MYENISFTGITPLEYYPSKKCFKYCKQNIETANVCVPCQKPEIESIEEVKVNISILEYKIIDSILGAKLIIHGEFNIKIIYTANNCEQSIHSAHWNIPFYDFILLRNMCCVCAKSIFKVFAAIEDVSLDSFCEKDVSLSLLYIMCPMFDINCSCNRDICDEYSNSYCSKHQKEKNYCG